jgi:hypothetical protein
MTTKDLFDEVAFGMLKDFRGYVESRGGYVEAEFVKPFQKVDDPAPTYVTVLGTAVRTKYSDQAYRVGVTLAIMPDELPSNSRGKRALFKAQIVRVKKSMVKQYKEIELRHAYEPFPPNEDIQEEVRPTDDPTQTNA